MSSQKSSLLSAFNIHLLELLEDLKTLYPSDINIKTAIRLVSTLKKANPKMLIKGWKACVNDEYKKQIEAGDFDFFLNKDYDRDIGGDLKQSSSQILEAIGLIKVKFRVMNSKNREKTIKYVQNLTKLCDLYFSN
tara:strand:+ start:216 stop:620 length:405 start_codon:yes stop_codon:yes gene_type:complete